MPVLHLNLKKKWFDMIESGIKTEEYREIKPYWNRVFIGTGILIKGKNYHPTDIQICFSNGYAKNRRQNSYTCTGLRTGYGKEEWGANPDKEYYILTVGELLPF